MSPTSLKTITIVLILLLTVGCSSVTDATRVEGLSATPQAPTQSQETALQTMVAQTLSAPEPTPTQLPTDTAVPIMPTATNEPPQPTPTALPLAPCLPPNAQVQTGQVTQIVDGDTIHVSIAGQEFKVRYIGMDTPESTTQVEPYGPEASSKNSELVQGQTVTLVKDVSETDQYGRLLRYVFVGSTFVNYELVRQGFASVASYPPDVACIDYFRQAEAAARTSAAGLWAAPAPTPTLVVFVPTATTASSSGSGSAVCNCSGPDLDCKDFSPRSSAQPCFDYCRNQGFGDVFKLDRDGDGRVCE